MYYRFDERGRRRRERVAAQIRRYGASSDENILSRRPWYLVGVLLLLISLLFRDELVFAGGLAVLALGLIPEIWYRFCLSEVIVRRQVDLSRAEIGDEIPLVITIENRKILPLPRLDMVDEVPEQIHIVGAAVRPSFKVGRAELPNVFSLWAMQRVVRRYRMRALERGAYVFGPMRLRSGDPIGALTRDEVLDQTTHLLVHPLIVPIEKLGLPARAPLGDLTTSNRLLTDPLRIAGVRDYIAGDDPRHIHWKASARTGALYTKVFEPSAHQTITIFLDLRTYGRDDRIFGRGQFVGVDHDLCELAISAAASVASWALEQGYAVGLCANGTMLEYQEYDAVNWRPVTSDTNATGTQGAVALSSRRSTSTGRLRISPGTERGQLLRLMDALARLVAFVPRSINDIVAEEARRLPYGSTVVYVGAAEALGRDGVETFSRLRSAGHGVTLLLTGDTPLVTRRIDSLRLGGSETWHTWLRDTLTAHGLDASGETLAADASTPAEDAARVVLEARP